MKWAVCSEIGVLRPGTKDGTFGTINGTFGTKIVFSEQHVGAFGTNDEIFRNRHGTLLLEHKNSLLEQKHYFRNKCLYRDGTFGTKTVLSEHQRFANDIRRYFIHILGSASAFGQINTSCQFFGL